jgi:hypothetical protein
MRRTLFLVSAVAAATASSFAATSSNIVGYVKLSLGQGFSMIANQLDNGAGNKATAVLAGVPNNTSVYKFVNGNFLLIQLVGGTWEGDDVDMTLAPGEGVFIDLPAATAVTFVGEVKTGTSSVTLPAGFAIISSVIPQSLALDQSPTGANFPAANGDGVYRYKPATSSYELDEFLGGAWEGDSNGAAPTAAVGEAFWVNNKSTVKSWSRTFNVN